MSPGGVAPAGPVPLPGLAGHRGMDNGGVAVSVSGPPNGNHYGGGGGGRAAVYSPELESPPTPVPPPAPGGSSHQHRPVSLSTAKSSGKSSGKRTRWLLCYHVGGGPPSNSPSPPSEQGDSQCSTPSPTDHGFKLPNSFSNERPTSLPVALLNCSTSGASHSDCVVPRGVMGESIYCPLPAREFSLSLSVVTNCMFVGLSHRHTTLFPDLRLHVPSSSFLFLFFIQD